MGEVGMEVEVEVVAAKENDEVVRWEKFLPRMVLRVLLVEADDSTRQIITSLLQKCNYRVVAVSDGLTAWETLKARPRNIDLILTEVELPSISGYALLTLIMEHDICKNIPVIMMSSRDSISMVLKCMLKGAAGFLMKPVRRNELTNLWQHVWRRDMLAAGHLPQNLHVEQVKVEATAENIAEGDDSSDHASSMQKDKDRSEKRSDTESSCAMPWLEDESLCLQRMQDPSCLKNLSVYFSNIGMPRQKKCTEIGDEPDMTDPQMQEKTNGLRPKFLEDSHDFVKTRSQDDGIGLLCDEGKANIISEVHNSNKELYDCSLGAIDLIGSFDNYLKSSNEIGSVNEGANKSLFSPVLELSLRRSPPSGSKSQNASERHTLNHSDASAFSWYNNKTAVTAQPTLIRPLCNRRGLKESESKRHEDQYLEGTVGTSTPDATSGDSMENTMVPSTGQSGQSELTFLSNQQGAGSVPRMILENGHATHVPAPVFYAQSGLTHAWSPKPVKHREQSPFCMSTSVQSSSQTHSSEQGYHQSGITTYTTDQNAHEQDNKEHTHMKSGSSVDQSASGNGNLFDGSTNNDDKANCAVPCDQNLTIISNNNQYVSDGSKGVDSHRTSQREAALQKFRLKRKDRCFEKKVRYQSRKRLAEQRPRVKGQFVRQIQNDQNVTPVNNADGHKR